MVGGGEGSRGIHRALATKRIGEEIMLGASPLSVAMGGNCL